MRVSRSAARLPKMKLNDGASSSARRYATTAVCQLPRNANRDVSWGSATTSGSLALHSASPYHPAKLVESSSTISRYCRSEEHTSELQSHSDLVCRLLLEKKK